MRSAMIFLSLAALTYGAYRLEEKMKTVRVKKNNAHDQMDSTIEASFPASDPPSWTSGSQDII